MDFLITGEKNRKRKNGFRKPEKRYEDQQWGLAKRKRGFKANMIFFYY